MRIRAVFFDLDGTLVRYQGVAYESSWGAIGLAAGRSPIAIPNGSKKTPASFGESPLKLSQTKSSHPHIHQAFQRPLPNLKAMV